MNKFILGLSMVAVMSLGASDIGANMKHMRDGLLEMQDGFLYNNKDAVIAGIAKVKKSNEAFHDKESVATYLPADKKHLGAVTLLSAKRLNADLDAMSEYLGQSNMLEAAAIHSDVMKDCTRCHAIVRGW